MPTYSYKCKKCGFVFDVFKRINDTSEEKCPKCGGPSKKIITSGDGGIIFKGHGFYITDYKNKTTSKNNISKSVDKK